MPRSDAERSAEYRRGLKHAGDVLRSVRFTRDQVAAWDWLAVARQTEKRAVLGDELLRAARLEWDRLDGWRLRAGLKREARPGWHPAPAPRVDDVPDF